MGQIVARSARELLADLPPGQVDLVIADPPYGVGSLITKQRLNPFEDVANNEMVLADWLPEAYRALKDNGALYVFCTWRNEFLWRLAVQQAGFEVKNLLVWDKTRHGAGDLIQGYGPQHEFIIYCPMPMHKLRGSRPVDILRFDKVPELEMRYPYEKPVRLLQALIRNSSDAGDLVVDPFCGSGPTVEACAVLGRRYICGDVSAEAVAVAEKRVQSFTPLLPGFE